MDSPVFLLGAGASFDAGLPLASQLTQQMLETIEDSQGGFSASAKALNFVIGSIIGFDSRTGARPDHLPDIERVVSAVELLANRDQLEVAPFVEWDGMVATLETPNASSALASPSRELSRALAGRRIGRAGSGGELDVPGVVSAVEKMIDAQVNAGPTQVYAGLHTRMVQALDNLLDLDASKTEYLSPLVAFTAKANGTIATLNYDLSVELAGQTMGHSVADGTSRWGETGQLDWPKEGTRLLKLHGSLSWSKAQVEAWSSRGELVAGLTVGPRTPNDTPFLVFGRREKLRADGPFLQLLETFRVALAATDQLIVIGYSFSDDHINSLLAQWLNTGSRREIVVVDPKFPRPGFGTPRSPQLDLARQLNPDALPEKEAPRSRMHVVRQGARDFIAAMGSDPFGHGVSVSERF